MWLLVEAFSGSVQDSAEGAVTSLCFWRQRRVLEDYTLHSHFSECGWGSKRFLLVFFFFLLFCRNSNERAWEEVDMDTV